MYNYIDMIIFWGNLQKVYYKKGQSNSNKLFDHPCKDFRLIPGNDLSFFLKQFYGSIHIFYCLVLAATHLRNMFNQMH